MTPHPQSERDRTEGEAWAREHLERLLEARFSARATSQFLHASRERAAGVREQRPELAARADHWVVAGGAAWVVLATLGAAPFRRHLASGLAWWTATALMLRWHLGMVETDDGRPRQLGAADVLTLTRAWLVPVALNSPTPPVLAAGALSDVLDGALARRAEATRAGRDLEGLVDTCFSLAALRGLERAGRLGRAAALTESGRLLAGTALAFGAYLARAEPPDRALIGAARSAGVMRFAGLFAAAAGRRRGADALVASGALASLVLAAVARRRSRA